MAIEALSLQLEQVKPCVRGNVFMALTSSVCVFHGKKIIQREQELQKLWCLKITVSLGLFSNHARYLHCLCP